ncbi:MAG: serine/threonine-protein kinase, partial [Myxococcota bacterium]
MNDDDTRDIPGFPPNTGVSRRSDTLPAERASEQDLTTTAPVHGFSEDEAIPVTWLSRARAQDAGEDAASSGAEHHALTTHTSIGRYLLIEELGRGGMGIVFRAYDPLLRREVALKALLQGSMARPLERRRFLREAQAIARLKHPGLIPILDSGIEHGCPFFTMELIRGNTLRQRLEQPHSFSPQQAAHLIASLARAAHHAHEQGIIHRDIKPANILLESAETPRLGDFGVAWLDERAAPAAELLTLHEGEGSERPGEHLPGALVGTPAYMAPEQAQRLPQALGPWSDVYSMGAVLFHMLVGTPPPPAADTRASDTRAADTRAVETRAADTRA